VVGTYALRWVRGPGHSKRRDFERGYRKGLTDSVHNFSRELIAEGLKPPANYLCGRPIPTNSRRDAEEPAAAVSMGGGQRVYRFFAPQIYYLRGRRERRLAAAIQNETPSDGHATASNI